MTIKNNKIKYFRSILYHNAKQNSVTDNRAADTFNPVSDDGQLGLNM
jgi:hypothetical protein